MKPIQIIEKLIPWPLLKDISAVLDKGSRTDGKGILTHDKSYCYYTYKLLKHLIRALVSPKCDKDSGQSHFAHASVRLFQLSLKYKKESE